MLIFLDFRSDYALFIDVLEVFNVFSAWFLGFGLFIYFFFVVIVLRWYGQGWEIQEVFLFSLDCLFRFLSQIIAIDIFVNIISIFSY